MLFIEQDAIEDFMDFTHGWGKVGSEQRIGAVAALRALARGTLLFSTKDKEEEARKDPHKPEGKRWSRCRATLFEYANIYEEGREDDLLLNGLQLLLAKNDHLCDPTGSVSKSVKRVEQLLKQCYESPEGKEEKYRFYFIDYIRLGVDYCPKSDSLHEIHPSITQIETSNFRKANIDGVPFIERHLLNFYYTKPRRVLIGASFFFIFFFSIGLRFLIDYKINHEEIHEILGIFSSAVAGIPALIILTTFFIARNKFKYFFGKGYFLKFDGTALSVASYQGICPECGGSLALTKQWHLEDGRRIYIAVCNKNTKDHLFKFDSETLAGSKI